MSAFEAVAHAVGEATAYLVGRILGRTFKIEHEQAQVLGEYVVLGILVIVLTTITVVYS